MDERLESFREMESWKKSTLLVGFIVGALLGLGAAYMLIQNAEREGTSVSVTAGDGVKLGITAMGLLRQVADLGSRK